MFGFLIVLFMGLTIWLGSSVDDLRACILDQKCTEQYRSDNARKHHCDEPSHKPSPHPVHINGVPHIIFY